MKLVRDAIAAGIFNDLGSGSNVDLCVITKDKVDYIRPYEEANKKGVRSVLADARERSSDSYVVELEVGSLVRVGKGVLIHMWLSGE